MEKLILVLLFMFSMPALSRDIPSYVHLCRRNHPEFSKCFNNTMFEIIPYMAKGIPEMNIPPIDPLAFTTVKVNTGQGTAVSFEAELSNGRLYGVPDWSMPYFEANIDDVRFSAIIELPRIKIDTNYRVKGKIMLFEIDSWGNCEINATDLVLDVEWYGNHYLDKQGKKHIHFDKIEFKKVELHNMVLKFEDDSSERQPFIDAVNKAINENIESLAAELDVLIKDTLGEISLDYFNRVYKLFPNDQLFPED